MKTVKLMRSLTCLLLLAALLIACSPLQEFENNQPAPPSVMMPVGKDVTWDLVVIGDSSLWGCGDALAEKITTDLGVAVKVHDFALPALSAGSVREVLETVKASSYTLPKLPDALKEADYVIMFVNPLDSEVPGTPIELDACFSGSKPGACDLARFAQYTADMEFIWRKTIELRAGQPTILRATDIYNPLVAWWQENGVFDSCTDCWVNMSTAARQAAENLDIPFLSRYDAFNGADHAEDPREKGYIRDDGEHPTDLANEVTAQLLSGMGYDATIPN
ncbi:MAG: SGNH/GDSL hydrolase family protein [Anaerolineales bacterium]|nr:SGNH/GDSL hydrolase family protein [Anaerolineales bacterium]